MQLAAIAAVPCFFAQIAVDKTEALYYNHINIPNTLTGTKSAIRFFQRSAGWCKALKRNCVISSLSGRAEISVSTDGGNRYNCSECLFAKVHLFR